MKLKLFNALFALIFVLGATLAVPVHNASAATPITFTILHTNDFHGQLEASGSNPGMARVAAVVNGVRTAVGAGNVLLVDAGDEMQGSLLSNLQKGLPTIATFNAMGYNAATFGNHEFDWGQPNLSDRTNQATYQFVSANIVKGSCDTSNWTVPDQFKVVPYVVQTLNTTNGTVKVGFIGVSTTETPIITIASSTAGLCFKDPADSILHYYDTLKAQADVIVVLSHLGFNDGGYGYGIPVYGDKTLAQKLIDAGKPVPLIIGGHSHTNLLTQSPALPNGYIVGGKTTVVQAYYNGRQVGRADFTLDSGALTVNWQVLAVSTSGAKDPTIDALITTYANDSTYQALINQPIGYSAVDLPRLGGTVDNMMGTFIDDAIYNYLNTDGQPANDIDIFFNNAGGIRTDWCYVAGAWVNTGCVSGLHDPGLLTYGNMFTVLPFGNATAVGKMTGAQILEVINHGPQLAGSAGIQPAGLKYKYYAYRDANPGPQPYAWGGYDICVMNKTSQNCDSLDLTKIYSVGTNEFLAPAGGDGYSGFKYMTNITYWGDMLNAVDAYVTAHYGTPETAYKGPNGDGTLDGRIVRDGTDTRDSGSIIPITVLHHNDSHGNLAKGTFVGYTQLATLIKQERLHNPDRTLLLDGGDQIQGDAMMYYFKSAPSGFAADGTPLPAALQTHPMMAVMNAMNYDGMDLGNHEFNFGGTVFTGIFKQAQFPLLGANVTDSGKYGLSQVGPGGQGVQPFIEKTLGGIKVAVLGITNHRVPNYELPSNIVGLTFSNPIATAQQYVPDLKTKDDVVIALTHIGFTTNPKSVEVDNNVDTNLAAQVEGVDAIIGSHSHTNPASPEAPYKSLPAIVSGPTKNPVIINQAYRYNNTLGEVVLGVRAKAGGGYEVVTRAGQYLSVAATTTEDPVIKAIVDPYVAQLMTYNDKVVGQTTVPIDTLQAFTQETNGANLQADASVWELNLHGITPDFHLSGAMTNKLMAAGATAASPVTLKISDMFGGMPYENSLVTMSMNGPQLKTVLERAYRNYYYYKYVPGYGGYSYYTTCMIDTNFGNQISYNDLNPALPNGNNVVSLVIGGKPVNFADSSKYYLVSTVNYLAAGSCNFNDNGVSLWPLNQIVNDTQYYVRDAVIDYITAKGIVSPAIEGRLKFQIDTTAPAITKTIGTPVYTNGANTYVTSDTTLTITVKDTFNSCSITVTGPDLGVTYPGCVGGDNVLKLTGPDGAYNIKVNVWGKTGGGETFTETDILDNTNLTLTKTIGDPKYQSGVRMFVKSTTPIKVAADDGPGSGAKECTLAIDGHTATPYTGGDFFLPKPDRKHTLAVVCSDNLGHVNSLAESDWVDDTSPSISVYSPRWTVYLHPDFMKLAFSAVDAGSGLKSFVTELDEVPVKNMQMIDLYSLSLGNHSLVLTAVDNLGSEANKRVNFSVTATIDSLQESVNRFFMEKKIKNWETYMNLRMMLAGAEFSRHDKTKIHLLNAFINYTSAQRGKKISTDAADLLITDANWVIKNLK